MKPKNHKTYHITTIGCYMNIVDSERLAAFLNKEGFRPHKDIIKANMVIINTCGVKQTAENRAYGIVDQIRKRNKEATIILTGCLSRRRDVQRRLADKVDIFMPINEMPNLSKLLAGRELKPKLSLDEVRLMQGEKYLTILPQHKNTFSALIPIGNGCNNFCSYCVVPYARGREVYRPAKDILKEVKALVIKGYKEITLIAQNVNSYEDKNYDFSKLLKEIVKIPGKFWIRFSSSHPKDMSTELIKIIGSSDKICSHLHLAVQSGDDDILRAMNRKYTVKHYIDLIHKVREAKPGTAITTDVIVGFPGETKKQFNNTVKLFKEINFDLAYISQYSPRPQTVSYDMKDNVLHVEKKRRDQVLTGILRITALKSNEQYLDKEVEVLIDGINKQGRYLGKTSSYKTIRITPETRAVKKMIGQFVKVRIDKVQDFGMEGSMIIKKSQ